jgi:hypothetical protein
MHYTDAYLLAWIKRCHGMRSISRTIRIVLTNRVMKNSMTSGAVAICTKNIAMLRHDGLVL